MPAHKHAALILQYAHDAAETDTPWEWWQCCGNSSKTWTTLTASPRWDASVEYRRKPKTIMCNGFNVEAPVPFTASLNLLDYSSIVLFVADPTAKSFFYGCHTLNQDEFSRCLCRGTIHATKDAAIAHAKAMLGIDPKGERND